MTQEEKQLLLRDLCARLLYRVKVKYYSMDYPYGSEPVILTPYLLWNRWENISDMRPYLRPMSSMTEEERRELKNVTCPNGTGYFNEQYLVCPVNHFGEHISFDFMSDIIDWLNAHHFDYRGLIEKGLAFEAPEDMYKTE